MERRIVLDIISSIQKLHHDSLYSILYSAEGRVFEIMLYYTHIWSQPELYPGRSRSNYEIAALNRINRIQYLRLCNGLGRPDVSNLDGYSSIPACWRPFGVSLAGMNAIQFQGIVDFYNFHGIYSFRYG